MWFSVIDALIQVLTIAIFIRVIFSWFNIGPNNFLTNFVYEITEPLLAPFRRFTTAGAIDFSPLVVIIILELARELIRRFLF